jgi:CheY-like chemotaxis protein
MTLTFLLVDDDDNDQLCFRRIIEEMRADVNLLSATDGRGALNILMSNESVLRAPPPDLILVDLNMPGMDGFELLNALRASPATRSLPVVVLTTSSSPEDMRRSRELGAQTYIVKPQSVGEYAHVIRDLVERWTSDPQPFRHIA